MSGRPCSKYPVQFSDFSETPLKLQLSIYNNSLHQANVPMAAPLASDGPQRFGRSSNSASIVLDIDNSRIRHDHHGTVAILAQFNSVSGI